MRKTIALLAIATGTFFGIAGTANAEGVSAPLTCTDAPEYMPAGACGLPGDDNHDGYVDEDESGWDCATMGNLVCGLPEFWFGS